jgi:hypothetical protein
VGVNSTGFTLAAVRPPHPPWGRCKHLAVRLDPVQTVALPEVEKLLWAKAVLAIACHAARRGAGRHMWVNCFALGAQQQLRGAGGEAGGGEGGGGIALTEENKTEAVGARGVALCMDLVQTKCLRPPAADDVHAEVCGVLQRGEEEAEGLKVGESKAGGAKVHQPASMEAMEARHKCTHLFLIFSKTWLVPTFLNNKKEHKMKNTRIRWRSCTKLHLQDIAHLPPLPSSMTSSKSVKMEKRGWWMTLMMLIPRSAIRLRACEAHQIMMCARPHAAAMTNEQIHGVSIDGWPHSVCCTGMWIHEYSTPTSHPPPGSLLLPWHPGHWWAHPGDERHRTAQLSTNQTHHITITNTHADMRAQMHNACMDIRCLHSLTMNSTDGLVASSQPMLTRLRWPPLHSQRGAEASVTVQYGVYNDHTPLSMPLPNMECTCDHAPQFHATSQFPVNTSIPEQSCPHSPDAPPLHCANHLVLHVAQLQHVDHIVHNSQLLCHWLVLGEAEASAVQLHVHTRIRACVVACV